MFTIPGHYNARYLRNKSHSQRDFGLRHRGLTLFGQRKLTLFLYLYLVGLKPAGFNTGFIRPRRKTMPCALAHFSTLSCTDAESPFKISHCLRRRRTYYHHYIIVVIIIATIIAVEEDEVCIVSNTHVTLHIMFYVYI